MQEVYQAQTQTQTPTFRVLLTGEAGRDEFRDAVATLERLARVTIVADPRQAAAVVAAAGAPFELVVIAQAYPGQVPAAAVERLRQALPLAPIVALLGSWCEGEVRTGRPWPGVIRVYAHQFPGRCRAELGRLAQGLASPWTLPATASEEERLLAEPDAPATGRGAVAAASLDRAMRAWLGDALRRYGFTPVALRPGEPVPDELFVAAIFDAPGPEHELDGLAALAEGVGGAATLALMAFPRPHEIRAALEAGAAAVLSKPLVVDDLIEELRRWVPEGKGAGLRVQGPGRD